MEMTEPRQEPGRMLDSGKRRQTFPGNVRCSRDGVGWEADRGSKQSCLKRGHNLDLCCPSNELLGQPAPTVKWLPLPTPLPPPSTNCPRHNIHWPVRPQGP